MKEKEYRKKQIKHTLDYLVPQNFFSCPHADKYLGEYLMKIYRPKLIEELFGLEMKRRR